VGLGGTLENSGRVGLEDSYREVKEETTPDLSGSCTEDVRFRVEKSNVFLRRSLSVLVGEVGLEEELDVEE